MKRPLWIVLTLCALVVGGYFILGNKEKPTAYHFEKIDRGDIVVSISATGTLSAVTTVTVGSQVSGTIASLHADFNSVVKKGQLLAQLDPTLLQTTVQGQRANLDRAKAQRNDADRTYTRLNSLFKEKLVSQADLDAGLTALESAEAGLRQAEASVSQAEVNLRYATIRSPIDGVVISRSVDVGQTVAASLSAPVLFTIAQDMTHMEVQASVTEADIGQVSVGLPVSFRVDAYPNDIFKGKVSQVRLAPVIVQNVVTYQVIIGVENTDLKLMPGMTATITIEAARRNNVLRLPVVALRFAPSGFASSMTDRQGGEGSGGMRSRPEGMADSSGKRADLPDSVREKRRAEWRKQHGDSAQGQKWSDSTRGSASHMASNESRQNTQMGRVFQLVQDSLSMVRIRTGLSTTRYTELISDVLHEGDSVVVGVEGSLSSTTVTTNPFAPQMPGGRPAGGGGGGGGRRGGM